MFLKSFIERCKFVVLELVLCWTIFKVFRLHFIYFRLTLELSCAMKFEAYPHDTQNCSMMIESRKCCTTLVIIEWYFFYLSELIFIWMFLVSHTTDDLIFLWNFSTPLVVSEDVELPQLDIVESKTEDCTLEYSTGEYTFLIKISNEKPMICLWNVYFLWKVFRLPLRQLYQMLLLKLYVFMIYFPLYYKFHNIIHLSNSR